MIFVIMGMDAQPFDRLARAVDELQEHDALGEEFFMQLGACTYVPQHTRVERFLPFGVVCENIKEASAVVTHAGAGSTLVCIQQGKHPVIVPRRASLKEAVDDHQFPFAMKLAEGGLATPAYEMSELGEAIVAARKRTVPGRAIGGSGELCRWLEGFWQGLAR